jgi:hypothetical protein
MVGEHLFGVKSGQPHRVKAERARWILRVGLALTSLWIALRSRPSQKD